MQRVLTCGKEYSESGQGTGEELQHRNGGIGYGAIALGTGRLLAFYGNMVAKGTVLSYSDHRIGELKLECVPRSYGVSNDPEYAGAICTSSLDREPEHGGDKTLSSEFFLLRTAGPTVIWRERMSWIGVANGNGPDVGFQKGEPLIYRSDKEIWIVAPTKSSALAVYDSAHGTTMIGRFPTKRTKRGQTHLFLR